MKKILSLFGAALLMAGCTEDFKDWANPQTNAPEEPKGVVVTVGAIDGTIDLANAGDTVQVFIPSVELQDAATTTYHVVMADQDVNSVYEMEADAQGFVKSEELQNAVVKLYNTNPNVERTLKMTITSYTVINGQSIKYVSKADVKVRPVGPNIEEAYYFTGTLNNWDNTNTDYELSNGGLDPFENPIFTMRIPASADGSDIEFKMTPLSGLGGDWSKCLAGNGEGKFAYDNGGDGSNLKITAVEGAVSYKVTFDMLEQTYTVTAGFANPETWYLVGSCIGDGSWGNSSFDNVGTSLFPLSRVSGTTISYTGYFTTDGFKLIKTPGSWSDQWGQGANGYVKNDGGSGNITVPTAGYYTVTLNTMTDELTIEPADVTPADYEVGMAGSFNGWSFQAMTKCAGSDHLWRFELEANGNEEAKFLIDGWSVNWGSKDFPSGFGVQNGDNIPVERGKYIVVFNDITGGYNFIQTDAPEEPVKEPEVWYLVGSCIGDGSWGNSSVDNVGASLFPLACNDENTISYTGYFTTDGFKLIKTPGSWDNQWGQGADGYVKNDGGSGNITVPQAGYYTVTLNTATDQLTIVSADITPESYEVGMAGSFNDWGFQAMTKCAGSDHLWKYELTVENAVDAKFLIDGWSVNWGAAEFPSGFGVQNGANIPVAAGSYIVIFNDITGGYNFIKK